MARNYIKVNGTNISTWYANDVKLTKLYANNVLIYNAETLVFNGTTPTSYTGGWGISNEYSNERRNYATSGSYLRSGKTSGYGPNQAYMVVSNNVAINVTNYSKAIIEYETTGNASYCTWAIGVSSTRGQRSGQISGTTTLSRRTGEIDLSNINGNAYFNLYAYTTGGGIGCSVTVYKISLE